MKSDLGYKGKIYTSSASTVTIPLRDMEVAVLIVDWDHTAVNVVIDDLITVGADGSFHAVKFSLVVDSGENNGGYQHGINIGSSETDTVYWIGFDRDGSVPSGYVSLLDITFIGVKGGKRIWLCVLSGTVQPEQEAQ
jgi:hypothetical protein